MKIGLFFGSFNPIHVGHLIIGSYFVNYTDLQQLWLVVSPQNPLKEKDTLLAEHHRLALVRLAVEDDHRLKECNVEFALPRPSYTIDTLTYLQEKYPQYQFILIMGTDNISNLHKWKNYEILLNQYEIYVYPRIGYDGGKLIKHPKVNLFSAPLMEIASQKIRKAIKEKKDVRYLLPPKVHQYIQEMHFYE